MLIQPPKRNRALLPGAFALMLVLMTAGVIGVAVKAVPIAEAPSPDQLQTETPHTNVNQVAVLIATRSLQPGEAFEESALGFARYDADLIPADALTTSDTIADFVAAAPISARSIITRSLLAREVTVLDSAFENAVINPQDELLEALEARLGSTLVAVTGQIPRRGSEVTVFAVDSRSNFIKLADRAWVKSAEEGNVVLLLSPIEIPLVNEAGKLTAIRCLERGDTPAEGKVIPVPQSIAELRTLLR